MLMCLLSGDRSFSSGFSGGRLPTPFKNQAKGVALSSDLSSIDQGFLAPIKPANLTPTPQQPRNYLSKLVVQMKTCLEQLGAVDVTHADLEGIAIIIHESMSTSNRNYHSLQHVFDMSKDMEDPICILSTFCHDIVYYQVDGSLTKTQARILEGTYEESDQEYKFFSSKEDSNDNLLKLVEFVIGVPPGQEITITDGLNEFLSAVIAVRELKDYLPIETLAQIVCCIEATIPFRPRNEENGLDCMEQLYERMQEAKRRFSLELDDNDLVASVQRASIVANHDVGGFGSSDRRLFLDQTWSLLPEGNAKLRHQHLYTVKDYHHAIFNMYGFFGFLNPSVVFPSFRGVPSDEELSEKLAQCYKNIEISKKYIGAKLLSTSLLCIFAELTGGDAPMCLFTGDLPSQNHVPSQIGPFPQPTPQMLKECDQEVYSILAHGRRTETIFDTQNSPVAAYIYSHLGDEGLEKLLCASNKWFPIEAENSVELLSAFPPEIFQTVATNLKEVAVARSEMIDDVLSRLPNYVSEDEI